MKPDIVEGSFAALWVARDMNKFLVTVISIVCERELSQITIGHLKSRDRMFISSLPVGTLVISVFSTKGNVCLITL